MCKKKIIILLYLAIITLFQILVNLNNTSDIPTDMFLLLSGWASLILFTGFENIFITTILIFTSILNVYLIYLLTKKYIKSNKNWKTIVYLVLALLVFSLWFSVGFGFVSFKNIIAGV